jgi:hypothetical protein
LLWARVSARSRHWPEPRVGDTAGRRRSSIQARRPRRAGSIERRAVLPTLRCHLGTQNRRRWAVPSTVEVSTVRALAAPPSTAVRDACGAPSIALALIVDALKEDWRTGLRGCRPRSTALLPALPGGVGWTARRLGWRATNPRPSCRGDPPPRSGVPAAFAAPASATNISIAITTGAILILHPLLIALLPRIPGARSGRHRDG